MRALFALLLASAACSDASSHGAMVHVVDDAGRADAPSDAGAEAAMADAATDADAGPPLCCTSQGVTEQCPAVNGETSCYPAKGYCTLSNVLGTLAACPVCAGVTDGGAYCWGSWISQPNEGTQLLCVCPTGTMCLFTGGSSSPNRGTGAECR